MGQCCSVSKGTPPPQELIGSWKCDSNGVKRITIKENGNCIYYEKVGNTETKIEEPGLGLRGWSTTPGENSSVVGNVMCIEQKFDLKRDGENLIVNGEFYTPLTIIKMEAGVNASLGSALLVNSM